MTAVAPLHTGATVAGQTFSPQQIALIKNSVAPDLTAQEFNLFIEECRTYGLNPITKQIYAVVYNKDKPEKRNVVKIASISGQRAIAYRTGNYRPDDEEPVFEVSEDAVDPQTNPKGIVKATVKVYQRHGNDWFKVAGVARWEEFAPIEEEWAYDPSQGKRARTGKKKPGAKWADMPFHMLAKCAESQALRRAFPELEGLYEPAEVDHMTIDVTPTEIVEAERVKDRRALIGDKTMVFAFSPMEPAEAFEASKALGRLMDYVRAEEDPNRLQWFMDHNNAALKQFWAESPDEALELKRALEDRCAVLASEAAQ